MERNEAKALVSSFLEAFSAADFDAAFALLDPAGAWKIWSGSREPDVMPIADMRARLEAAAAMMVVPIVWQAQSLTAEGAHVFAEIAGSATTKSGFEYRNSYAILFGIEGGRIALIEEMFEAAPVDALMQELQPA